MEIGNLNRQLCVRDVLFFVGKALSNSSVSSSGTKNTGASWNFPEMPLRLPVINSKIMNGSKFTPS